VARVDCDRYSSDMGPHGYSGRDQRIDRKELLNSF
jgi:hypothetical protein